MSNSFEAPNREQSGASERETQAGGNDSRKKSIFNSLYEANLVRNELCDISVLTKSRNSEQTEL